MYLANIVTRNKIEISSFFNVTNCISDIDIELPTLIIGWNLVKELFPEQNILVSQINNNIYWTFSKREKRYQYEKDLETFIEKVRNEIDNRVNYRFFNYLTANDEKQKSFINYVNKGNCSIYYNSRFLYVYNANDQLTIGISLNYLKYNGITISNFIKTLNTNNNNFIIDNLKYIDENSLSFIKDNTKSIAFLNYLKITDIYKKIIPHDKTNY